MRRYAKYIITLSKNGNSMSVAAKGVNAVGQTVDANSFYDKQK